MASELTGILPASPMDIKEENLHSENEELLDMSVKCEPDAFEYDMPSTSGYDASVSVKTEETDDEEYQQDDDDTEDDEMSGDDEADEDYEYEVSMDEDEDNFAPENGQEHEDDETVHVKSESERNNTRVKSTDKLQKVRCDQCGEYFKSTSLQNHQKLYHTSMLHKFVCPAKTCNYTTGNFSNMKLHVRRRHTKDMTEEERLKFQQCKSKHAEKKLVPNPYSVAGYPANINRKMQGSCKKIYLCPVDGCDTKCNRQRDVKGHLANKHRHDLSPEELLSMTNYGISCKFVSKEDSTESNTHAGTLPNTNMGKNKIVSSPPNDSKSVEIHRKSKQKSKAKSKDATNPDLLEQRVRIRYKKKIFCPDCDWQYYGMQDKQSLRYHQRCVHTRFVDKFECPVPHCSHLTFQKRKITSHVIVKHCKELSPADLKHYLQRDIIRTKVVENRRYQAPKSEITSTGSKAHAKINQVGEADTTNEHGPVKQETCDENNSESSQGQDNDSKTTQCKKCSKYFYGPKCRLLLEQHNRENHEEKNVKCYVCPLEWCNFVGTRSDYIKNHLRTHLKHKKITLEAFKVYSNPQNYVVQYLPRPQRNQ